MSPGAVALLNKLALFTELAEEDRRVLGDLLSAPEQRVERGQDLVSQGEMRRAGYVFMTGWAARYKTLPDGRRQILSFLAPGDLIGLFVPVSPYATTSISALSDVTATAFAPNALLDIMGRSPRLGAALAWAAAREQEILAEHLVSLGRRSARERVAHLFLELWARLRVRGLTNGHKLRVPLTQHTIADTMGLSVVHVNRTLRQLAHEGLLEVRREHATILDIAGLQAVAGFDEDYLLHHYIPEELRSRLDVIAKAPGFDGTDIADRHGTRVLG
jgi:CRP-like cAMP-binding protein